MVGLAALALAAPAVAQNPPPERLAPRDAPQRLRQTGDPRPLGTERLSDERTLTRWTHAAVASPIRTAPRSGARALGRLRFLTEDGVPEVYVALASRRMDNGSVWLRIRVPGRPNGRTGWVDRDDMNDLNVVRTWLHVEKRAARATLYRGRRRLWRAQIGHGAPGTPTPTGRFYVRELLRNIGGAGVYGPWAFGTSAYSALSDWPGGGVIGIHGTDQPQLIPGRPSHGCIRVPNAAIRRLARLMPIGTPVRITL